MSAVATIHDEVDAILAELQADTRAAADAIERAYFDVVLARLRGMRQEAAELRRLIEQVERAERAKQEPTR